MIGCRHGILVADQGGCAQPEAQAMKGRRPTLSHHSRDPVQRLQDILASLGRHAGWRTVFFFLLSFYSPGCGRDLGTLCCQADEM